MRCQLVLLLVSLLFTLLSLDSVFVSASHFRYGTITSQTTAGSNTVTFTITVGLRRSYYQDPNTGRFPQMGDVINTKLFFTFGDGTPDFLLQPTIISVGDSPFLNPTDQSSIPANDWFLARTIVDHTYPNPTSFNPPQYAYIAEIGDTCCRLDALLDGNTGLTTHFRITTTVIVSSGYNSPVSSLPPVINVVPVNGVYTFSVPAVSDTDTDKITYGIASATMSSLVTKSPAGLSINRNTGLVTWNVPAGETLGWYALQVIIYQNGIVSNAQYGVNSNQKSYIVVDFLLYLNPEQPVIVYHPPQFIDPTPSKTNAAGVYLISVQAGTTQFIPIAANDPLDASVVTINQLGLPEHCTWTTSPAVASTAGITCSPTHDQIGQVWLISMTATEPHGLQTIASFPYTVWGSNIVGDPQFTGFSGQSYQVHGVSDAIYNIISSPHLQYNALFSYLDSGKCRTATPCYSHPGNYFGAVGIVLRDGAELPTEVKVTSGSVTDGLTVTANNVVIPVGSSIQVGIYKLTVNTKFEVEIDSEEFSLRIQNSDHFLNQDVAIGNALLEQISAYKHAVKENDNATADELAAKLPHGLLGQSWSTKTYPNRWKHIEGHLFDYQVQDGIMGKEFRFNRF